MYLDKFLEKHNITDIFDKVVVSASICEIVKNLLDNIPGFAVDYNSVDSALLNGDDLLKSRCNILSGYMQESCDNMLQYKIDLLSTSAFDNTTLEDVENEVLEYLKENKPHGVLFKEQASEYREFSDEEWANALNEI